MIGFLLIVEVPNASDKRGVALGFRPIDGLALGFKGAEHIGMVLDDIIVDLSAFGPAFGRGSM